MINLSVCIIRYGPRLSAPLVRRRPAHRARRPRALSRRRQGVRALVQPPPPVRGAARARARPARPAAVRLAGRGGLEPGLRGWDRRRRVLGGSACSATPSAPLALSAETVAALRRSGRDGTWPGSSRPSSVSWSGLATPAGALMVLGGGFLVGFGARWGRRLHVGPRDLRARKPPGAVARRRRRLFRGRPARDPRRPPAPARLAMRTDTLTPSGDGPAGRPAGLSPARDPRRPAGRRAPPEHAASGRAARAPRLRRARRRARARVRRVPGGLVVPDLRDVPVRVVPHVRRDRLGRRHRRAHRSGSSAGSGSRRWAASPSGSPPSGGAARACRARGTGWAGRCSGSGGPLLGACPGPLFALLGGGVTVMAAALAAAMAGDLDLRRAPATACPTSRTRPHAVPPDRRPRARPVRLPRRLPAHEGGARRRPRARRRPLPRRRRGRGPDRYPRGRDPRPRRLPLRRRRAGGGRRRPAVPLGRGRGRRVGGNLGARPATTRRSCATATRSAWATSRSGRSTRPATRPSTWPTS